MAQGLSRICVFSFFRISLDSVIVLESSGLDSVSCASFRISALDSVNVLDSESTLDSVDSKFLRVVFSRILSNFLESCVFSQKGVFPSPRTLKAPKKPPLFLLRFACKPLARQTGREPRFSASSAIVAEALLPPFLNDCTPRSGREVVGADALPH